ncbi:MAG: DUF3365 domain-containing protein [Magnetococcales bacterium]|nr:DUF3365 domain-containing protein [Magnetococcales bacterium]
MKKQIKTKGKLIAPAVGIALMALPTAAYAFDVPVKSMADALYLVLKSDRTAYTKLVVNRLANEEKVIDASEQWEEDAALPLPAQMFRAGAEMTLEESDGKFSYSLLSLWPINSQNAARTKGEKDGLKFVFDNPGKNYYTTETLGGKTYYTAVYPDNAVVDACVSCHNGHDDSPKKDFKLGDNMGAVVIRIAK